MTGKGTSTRGFAGMDTQLQREIARKGGLAVSGNREHMAEIGRKGGEISGARRSQKLHSEEKGSDIVSSEG